VVFPEWWLYAPVPVSFAFLAVEFLRRILAREPLTGAGPHA
jgi:TRAP-type C4-dicarboxylate transport system permease small subunit